MIRVLAWATTLAVFIPPLALPYISLINDLSSFAVWSEGERIAALLSNTTALVFLTLFFAFPPGILLAIGFANAGTKWQLIIRALLLVGLATPLPVTAVAWHAIRIGRWTPFTSGLLPAAALHALAGLPWVALI